MIVADTNVVSEFMKDVPDSAVVTWAQGLSPSDVAITVVTVQEVEYGLRRMPSGRRQRDLQQRWAQVLDTFVDQVVCYDVNAAGQTAAVLAAAAATGRHMSLADAQIAGICVAGQYDLATRNVGDFTSVAGLTLINPFAPFAP